MKPLVCSNCGKTIELGKDIVGKIRVNGQWWKEYYCSKKCQSGAQMAAEG